MPAKHILFVTQMLPYPLDSGAKVRAYYMLRHLAERHRVTLCSLAREADAESAVAHVEQFCERVLLHVIRRSAWADLRSLLVSLLTGRSALIVRDHRPCFRKLILALLGERRFDAVHVDQIKAAQHVQGIRGVPCLIDMHNVYYEVIEGLARLATSPLRRWLLRREARVMACYENAVCHRFDEILAVTEPNAQRLREMIGQRRPVTTIPICVDPSETPFSPSAGTSRDLLCAGAMFYPPNVDGVLWFIREILPHIRREVPDARLRLVGPRPDRAILRAAAGEDHILVTGYANDMSQAYAACAAAIVPLRAGSGMRVKILDAMARGLPVISTRLGAEGIHVSNDENILLADDPKQFAQAAVRLLRDAGLRARIAQNARQLIESEYDWRRRYVEVDAVYQRLFSRGG